MNLVGVRGRGESVWLGWFLCATLLRFAPLCEAMGESERAEELRARAAALRAALERSGWDGRWYRRGYYDDGSPLGSARQRRMPHRFAGAVVGGAVGGRPIRAAPGMAMEAAARAPGARRATG